MVFLMGVIVGAIYVKGFLCNGPVQYQVKLNQSIIYIIYKQKHNSSYIFKDLDLASPCNGEHVHVWTDEVKVKI